MANLSHLELLSNLAYRQLVHKTASQSQDIARLRDETVFYKGQVSLLQ